MLVAVTTHKQLAALVVDDNQRDSTRVLRDECLCYECDASSVGHSDFTLQVKIGDVFGVDFGVLEQTFDVDVCRTKTTVELDSFAFIWHVL